MSSALLERLNRSIRKKLIKYSIRNDTQVLSVDHPATYLPLLIRLLSENELLGELEDKYLRSEDSFRTFWNSLDENAEKSCLVLACEKVLFEKIPNHSRYLVAYHGCLYDADSTYDIEGIKITNTDALVEKAIREFKDVEQVKTIVRRLRSDGYIRYNDGKVFAVKSLDCHTEHGNWCHTKGSEILRIIADRMRPSRLSDYLARGEPSIIEFLVPIDWTLKDNSFNLYIANLIRLCLLSKSHFEPPSDARLGGLVFNRPIQVGLLSRRYVQIPGSNRLRIAKKYRNWELVPLPKAYIEYFSRYSY